MKAKKQAEFIDVENERYIKVTEERLQLYTRSEAGAQYCNGRGREHSVHRHSCTSLKRSKKGGKLMPRSKSGQVRRRTQIRQRQQRRMKKQKATLKELLQNRAA